MLELFRQWLEANNRWASMSPRQRIRGAALATLAILVMLAGWWLLLNSIEGQEAFGPLVVTNVLIIALMWSLAFRPAATARGFGRLLVPIWIVATILLSAWFTYIALR